MNTRYKLGASLAGATLLVVLAAVAAFLAFGQIEKAAEARRHTHEVINRADALLSALRDAETGQRGYSLTGDATFLEPYAAVHDTVNPVKETLAHGTIQGLANHTILIARDGSEHAIADSCAPIRDRNGQVIGTVLVFRDVTREYATLQAAMRDLAARKRAEEALLKAGALQTAIFNSAKFSSIATDAKGVIQIFNVGAERMLGFSQLMMR